MYLHLHTCTDLRTYSLLHVRTVFFLYNIFFVILGRKYIRNPKNGPKKKFLNHNDLFIVYTGV